MRPGTRPAGAANRRGRRRRWWARSRAGQAAGTGRPGGGSAARPRAARSRRTRITWNPIASTSVAPMMIRARFTATTVNVVTLPSFAAAYRVE
jgi:hypothetical protein